MIFAQASFWLEPAASTSAQRHDTVFYTVLWVTVFFFALVVALMLLFIVLYRRRKGEPPRTGPHPQHAAGGRLDRHSAGHGDRAVRDGVARLRRFRHAAGRRRRWSTWKPGSGRSPSPTQRRRRRQAVPGGRSAGHLAASLARRAARALHPGLPRAAQRRAGPHRPRCGSARCGWAPTTSFARSIAATATRG